MGHNLEKIDLKKLWEDAELSIKKSKEQHTPLVLSDAANTKKSLDAYDKLGIIAFPIFLTIDPETGKKRQTLYNYSIKKETSIYRYGWKGITYNDTHKKSTEMINDYCRMYRTVPNAVGIKTGEGRVKLFVLDLDQPIAEAQEWLSDHNISIPKTTLQIRTQSGGIHYYFLMPDEFKDDKSTSAKLKLKNGNIAPVDMRGKGGLIYGLNSRVLYPDGKIERYLRVGLERPEFRTPPTALIRAILGRNAEKFTGGDKSWAYNGNITLKDIPKYLDLDAQIKKLVEAEKGKRSDADGSFVTWCIANNLSKDTIQRLMGEHSGKYIEKKSAGLDVQYFDITFQKMMKYVQEHPPTKKSPTKKSNIGSKKTYVKLRLTSYIGRKKSTEHIKHVIDNTPIVTETISKSGAKYAFSPHALSSFFRSNKIYVNTDTVDRLQNVAINIIIDNIVYDLNGNSLYDIITNCIDDLDYEDKSAAFDRLIAANPINNVNKMALPWRDFEVRKDSKDRTIFVFRDKVIKVQDKIGGDSSEDVKIFKTTFPNISDKNKIKTQEIATLSISDLKEPILSRQINVRRAPDFEISQDLSDSMYYKFLLNIAKPDGIVGTDYAPMHAQRLLSLKTIIGYMLVTYKDPAFARAIILTDLGNEDRSSGEAQGGTGKDILVQSLRLLRNVWRRSGKNTGLKGDKFFFGGLKKYTDIIYIEDVQKNYDIHPLYPAITGDLEIEEKFQDLKMISYDESPKIILSTNHSIRISSDSDLRRFVTYGFSHHYHNGYTPEDEFGCKLFEWAKGDSQWELVYKVLIDCVKDYRTYGLLQDDLSILNQSAGTLKTYVSDQIIDEIREELHEIEVEKTIKSELSTDVHARYQALDGSVKMHQLTEAIRLLAPEYNLIYSKKRPRDYMDAKATRRTYIELRHKDFIKFEGEEIFNEKEES